MAQVLQESVSMPNPEKRAEEADLINAQDVVLAYHGPLVYEAKVLKIDYDIEDNSKIYFLHYLGWKKTYDEWVGIERIMVNNAKNQEIQQQVQRDFELNREKERKLKKKRVSSASDSSKPKAKRRKIIESEEVVQNEALEKHLQISLPMTLKKQLVEDWGNVTKEPLMLVPLPRTPSVSQIVKNYIDSKVNKLKEAEEDASIKSLRQVFDGLKLYFDRALGLTLLYRSERKQYNDIRKARPNEKMSDIYGAEHLLRLFVRLPYVFAKVSVTDHEKRQMQTKFGDFLKFLQKHHSNWFITDYELATDEYCAANMDEEVLDPPTVKDEVPAPTEVDESSARETAEDAATKDEKPLIDETSEATKEVSTASANSTATPELISTSNNQQRTDDVQVGEKENLIPVVTAPGAINIATAPQVEDKKVNLTPAAVPPSNTAKSDTATAMMEFSTSTTTGPSTSAEVARTIAQEKAAESVQVDRNAAASH